VQDQGGLATTQNFTITVSQPNRPPLINSTPVTTATVGLLYSYAVAATDPDAGDVLTFALTTAPTGMAMNATTGLIQWTPTATQVGNNDVTVRVQDRGGLFATQNFTVTVSQPNQPPQITSAPITTAVVGHVYAYAVTATDPDAGDVLTFALTTAPTGMTINTTTGSIQWTPTAAQMGSQPVTVRVQDMGGLFAEQSFAVTVKVSNQAPVAVAGLLGAPNLPACVAPPGGLAAWYTGDGTFMDIIGANSPTSTVGSPQFVLGKVGQSISFDGNSGLIVPNNATIDFTGTDSFTIDVWVRVEGRTGGGDNLIVDKKGALPLNRGYGLSALLPPFSPSGTARFDFAIQENHAIPIFAEVTTRSVPLGEFITSRESSIAPGRPCPFIWTAC
jgi:hypothetical protein